MGRHLIARSGLPAELFKPVVGQIGSQSESSD